VSFTFEERIALENAYWRGFDFKLLPQMVVETQSNFENP